MANPNITAVTSVVANNAYVRLSSTSETQVVSNAASSGKVYIIDSIVVANVDGTNAADITLSLYAAATNTGTATKIAHTITVPADATLVIATKDLAITLKEAQSLYATASAADDLHVTAYWKEFS